MAAKDSHESRNWSAAAARQALEVACRAQGIPYRRLELLRFGHTAVYRLHPEDVVARVSRPDAVQPAGAWEIAFCRWLADKGFPIVCPLPGQDGSIEVYGSTVSFWQWLEHEPGVVDFETFGQLLRRFHTESRGYTGELAEWKPLSTIASGLRELSADERIDRNDIELLWRWQAYLEKELQGIVTELGFGPLYGAAHPGNSVRTADAAALTDPEHLCRGPREWDLIPMALGPRRFGGPRADYEAFCRGYGYDVTKVRYFRPLVLTRELLVTVWRMHDEMASPVRSEGERRLRYWRRDPNPPVWHPF